MLKKRWTKILLIFLVLALLTTHFFIPRLITEIRNPVVTLIKRNHTTPFNPNTIEGKENNHKNIKITSFDNLKLSGYLTFSNVDSVKGTIILLHGIRSNKEHFKNLSELLAKNGYNSVALDSRAHGESEGKHCTFGVKEKIDIQKLIDYLEQEEGINQNIGIWGQSLGGAISLQTMGIDERIRFGIIESAFSNFRSTTNDYFDLFAGFSYKPFTDYLVNRAGKIADFDPNEAKPVHYCKNIKQPILIVHGDKDKRINIKYAEENFKEIKSQQKEFMKIENANHLNVWKVGGEEYFIKILTFMDTVTSNKG